MHWAQHPLYEALVWLVRLTGYQLLFWLAVVAGLGVFSLVPALALLILRLRDVQTGRVEPLRPWLIRTARRWYWPAQRIGLIWLAIATLLLADRQLTIRYNWGAVQAATTFALLIWIAVLPVWLSRRFSEPSAVRALLSIPERPGSLLLVLPCLCLAPVMWLLHPLAAFYGLLSFPLALWVRLTRSLYKESLS
ncbi:DUF624 domain-containing protein [Saccharospirillum salsuginis]|uniref:DUF624 domain-containing protein n=1 Tax=Saccharospirillum salsuginis TaxID=418750 RepID=A0A918K6A9_9GAMM|nr:DUF624 domain-containing protein [Saccharospirillum salsuginis]GGX49119.1 hypothetical protein GCM10007392_15490 [Saccharospirillum salsuginis]